MKERSVEAARARIVVLASGMTAHAALARAGGTGRVLARLSASTYLRVGGEIVWLAGAGTPLHPRAILTAGPPHPACDDVRLASGTLAPWQPAAPALARVSPADLVRRWRDLAAAPPGTPLGFGALLAARPPAFPLDGAVGPARALARACACGDAAGAGEVALALLGVGGGLTPSGDDYVGGALFARAVLAAPRPDQAAAWRRTAARVVAAAPARTHPISAALLGDLAAGRSWAPLHDLAAALAAGTPRTVHAAARRLVALGHCSGWDMLAGVGAGLGALA